MLNHTPCTDSLLGPRYLVARFRIEATESLQSILLNFGGIMLKSIESECFVAWPLRSELVSEEEVFVDALIASHEASLALGRSFSVELKIVENSSKKNWLSNPSTVLDWSSPLLGVQVPLKVAQSAVDLFDFSPSGEGMFRISGRKGV